MGSWRGHHFNTQSSDDKSSWSSSTTTTSSDDDDGDDHNDHDDHDDHDIDDDDHGDHDDHDDHYHYDNAGDANASINNVDETQRGDQQPPIPWASSQAKHRIIDELKDKKSDIYLLIGHYTLNNFDHVNFPRILQKYAGNKCKMTNFRQNLKRILVHLLDKTGPFKGNKNNGVEKWYTSAKNMSKAYSLLFLLYMNPRNSRIINSMTAEEIWQSHPLFQKYELEKFNKYNKIWSC